MMSCDQHERSALIFENVGPFFLFLHAPLSPLNPDGKLTLSVITTSAGSTRSVMCRPTPPYTTPGRSVSLKTPRLRRSSKQYSHAHWIPKETNVQNFIVDQYHDSTSDFHMCYCSWWPYRSSENKPVLGRTLLPPDSEHVGSQYTGQERKYPEQCCDHERSLCVSVIGAVVSHSEGGGKVETGLITSVANVRDQKDWMLKAMSLSRSLACPMLCTTADSTCPAIPVTVFVLKQGPKTESPH